MSNDKNTVEESLLKLKKGNETYLNASTCPGDVSPAIRKTLVKMVNILTQLLSPVPIPALFRKVFFQQASENCL